MKYILGLGKTGVSVSKYLIKHKLPFVAWDDSELNREKASLMGVDIVAPTRAPWQSISEIICSPGIPLTFPEPHKAIALARQYHVPVRGDVDYWGQVQQGRGCKFIGITGTNGKSTTHSMVNYALNTLNVPVFSGGNSGVPVFDSGDLEPDSIINLELSSFQLDLIKSIEFSAGVLLNITPDHLDRHGDLETYVKSKRSLLDRVSFDGIKIIGVDTPESRLVYEQLLTEGVSKLVPISITPIKNGVYADDRALYRNIDGEVQKLAEIPSGILGEHQSQNLMAAMLLCEHIGINNAAFLEAMHGYPGLEHRQELVLETEKAIFVNDSKATNAAAVLPALKTHRNIYWIAGGLDKDEGVLPLLDNLQNIKRIYLIGQSSKRFFDQLQAFEGGVELFETLDEAMKSIKMSAMTEGEKITVLLSPAAASQDQFLNFEARGRYFKHLAKEMFEG